MRQKFLLGLLISLIVLGLSLIVYAVMNPEQNIFNYISGSATVVIAILTMAYVYITSRQLDVMSKQLEQIEIERRLQNQPLPYLKDMDVLIEKPRFYFSPPGPGDQYSAHARYWVKIKISNIGSHPAVCVDASAHIEIPGEDGKRYFSAASINIPTLGEREDYPVNKEDDNDFLFATDDHGVLIQALRERNVAKLPLLNCRILFRNIMGGCFLTSCQYRLYPEKDADDSLFSDWLAEMQSFWIKYKNDIERLKRLDSNDEKWDEAFNKLKESFSEAIRGEDIKIMPWVIPGSFAVKSISKEEYEKEVTGVAYGVKMSESMECIAR